LLKLKQTESALITTAAAKESNSVRTLLKWKG